MTARLFLLLYFFSWMPIGFLSAQTTWKVVRVNKQVSFPATVPAGNYSGLTPLGNELYAVVNDKSPGDGFAVMRIVVDSLTGEIKHVAQDTVFNNRLPNRDTEGIVYVPSTRTVWICGETDNQILAYSLDRQRKSLSLPASFEGMSHVYGLESLTYEANSHVFYTANESTLAVDGKQANATNGVANRIRIVAIGDDGKPLCEWMYVMDTPISDKAMQMYAMGVSELLALPDGRLLVLERELAVPHKKIGAFVNCKLFVVNPDMALRILADNRKAQSEDVSNPQQADGLKVQSLHKELLYQWKTKLNITARSWANYEGMCLGPQLKDGSQVIILVSDSQDQYAGVLKDWWKTLVIAPRLP